MTSLALAGLVVVVLVGAPVAVNAARDSEYAVSMEAFPAEQPGVSRVPRPVDFVRTLLDDPVVARNTSTTSGLELDSASLIASTALEPTLRSVMITVRADTPEHAQAIARGLRFALNDASANRLAFGPEPVAPVPPHRLDRLIERLPGPFPPRRDPLWVALAGLVVGCVLCGAAFAYRVRPTAL